MENKEYSSIIGSSSAPYINRLAHRYALATEYYATAHPSLPNYLDLVAGKDFGIDDDGESYVLDGRFLGSQLTRHSISWTAYMEGMPSDTTAPCTFPSGGQDYAKRHDPFAYFSWIQTRHCSLVQPYSNFDPSSMETVTWITPDTCHDMHDCSISTGDTWLKDNVPQILANMTGYDVLFLTWDEGTTSANGGGHVVTIVAGPGAKRRFRDSTSYSHFSLLRTVETLFGLAFLNHAGDDGLMDMTNMLARGPST